MIKQSAAKNKRNGRQANARIIVESFTKIPTKAKALRTVCGIVRTEKEPRTCEQNWLRAGTGEVSRLCSAGKRTGNAETLLKTALI